MALFQTSVLKNYLKRQDVEPVAKAYKKFSKYFHNPSIQQNIRDSKEEQFQEGFLRELFVDILGYTLNPQPNFNLTTELKNEKGAKKADGAILLDGNALGVIELKSTKTKDLESIRQQAFDYKANQTGCVYVVTSNFEKLRFYINNAVEFEEFDLFTLTQNQFELLYLCLHKDNLLSNVPLKIKEASVREEEVITKKFYNDYSLFKRELFRDLVKLNMKNEVYRSEFNREDTERANKNIKHNLFKKSQKLIDRFLFIFFAEDRDLLPPNSTLKILEQWNKLKDLDAYAPLYDRFKLYFGYLDTGRKGTEKGAEIFAYNGGLFKPDPILDSLQISDELLFKHTEALSKYDFESQVDVNILGHIFENSLNEIESVNAEIEGVEFDKQKTKRKKDGVFYTPKYITKYIVDNTVGKLCAEKKAELKIVDEEYTKNRKGRTTVKLKELRDQLENYRNWLLQITICDPACGSGAFLNQALDFLIKEHQYIDELQTSLLGGGFVFPDIENTVLENNIFGVDLNEESVEIAKLSLWLRTAQPRRKLNDLSSNIKCGNSLIDDPKVAGNKAFKWEDEFPQVFAKGGFDVVIGNPPYVSNKEMHRNGMIEQINHWNNIYKCAKSGNYDIYIPFIEKGIQILKNDCLISYIIPNKFLAAKYSKSLLELIKSDYTFLEIVDYSNVNVFIDASVYPIIITLKKQLSNSSIVDRIIVKEGAFEEFGLTRKWEYIDMKFIDSVNKEFDNCLSKIENQKNTINNELSFEPGINGFQFTNYSKCVTDGRINNDSKKLTVTGNIDPYIFKRNITRYLKKDYIEPFITYDSEIISEGKWSLFSRPKIMVAGMTKKIEASLDINGDYAPAVSVYSICGEIDILKQIIIIINSKLMNWFFESKFSDKHMAGGYISVNNLLLQQIPFKVFKTPEKAIILGENANKYRVNLESLELNFSNYLQSQFSIEKLSKKLQNWHELTFAEFIKEINKAIKTVGGTPLTKLQEMEWMEVFETKKAEAQVLKSEIDKTDKEIDKMVYELYGLSEEEIKIVENA
ncbi:MAG: Eco57I restriction-modification methylase domain-containing protein [Flavobacteriales bacterium]